MTAQVAAPYQDAAHRYLAAGWQGVLPVGNRPAQKDPPPTGYTGHDGRWPTIEEVDGWRDSVGVVNVALRLPRGVIGIDVDDYDGKVGADTMQAGLDAHGSPGLTWKSTSRTGNSGIRLYRVPEDLVLPGELKHPGKPEQSNVELIQFHHRYVVVAPSLHPKGQPYRWIAPDGSEGGCPTPGELPELPGGWRDHLAGTCSCYPRIALTIRGSGDPVADKLAEARAAINSGTASRHEGVAPPVLALVGFSRRGAPGAADALEDIHREYVASVTAPGHDRVESVRSAEGEWRRMTENGKAATAGVGDPPWEPSHADPRPAPKPPAPGPTTWPEPENRGQAVLSDLGRVEYVEDLIRPGRIVVWAAEEGSGKSYAVDDELGIRVAVAGGSFAGTWPILRKGPVLYLSEMHGDDDHDRETTVLASLGQERSAIDGKLYRLPLMTAAGGAPALTVPAWCTWITEWLRDRGALLLIVDTATGATQVDPWGKAIQAVFTQLRMMLDAYPALAIILIVHVRKPTGKGGRRLSDVLGEWGRWCDVVVMQENDGAGFERAKLTVRKRVRRERRIIATKAGGLLIDPRDVETATTGPKVPTADVLAAIAKQPGISYLELANVLKVAKRTATNYAKAIGSAIRAETTGPKGATRLYIAETGAEGTAQPRNTAQQAQMRGADAVPESVEGNGPRNRATASIRDAVRLRGPGASDSPEEYDDSDNDIDLHAEAFRIFGDDFLDGGAA